MKKLITSLIICLFSMAMHPAFAVEACNPVRNSAGKIKRSSWQVIKFKKTVACPATGKVQVGNKYTPCPGFVVDHVQPLCLCGKDAPSNMAWQTLEHSLIKDDLERKACNGKGD